MPTLFRWKKWKPETKKDLRDAFPGGLFCVKNQALLGKETMTQRCGP